jgi:hypothetical protein
MRLIGVLMGFAKNDPTAQSMVATFRAALAKRGWTEGGNVRIELRWSGCDRDRIKRLAKELVDLRPDAILGQTTPNCPANGKGPARLVLPPPRPPCFDRTGNRGDLREGRSHRLWGQRRCRPFRTIAGSLEPAVG